MPKFLPNTYTGQFTHASLVVTKPLAGVSITIHPGITDVSRLSLFTQSKDINECVAPILIIVIRGVLLIKHVPLIRLSISPASSPLKAKKNPQAFFGFLQSGQ
jgi:hypothetical protein